ncbi:hypothetical protein SFRURICE_013200 [Spodoptera frugiperda]|nr:hypothetical protein SFRURICE_013200 [Spodoptera frugiperda]
MLVQIILLFFLVWLLVLRWQRRKMIELSHKLGVTNHMTLPFVGHAYIFFGSDEDRMTKFQKLGREAIASEHGVTTIWQGHRLYLVVSDAKVAELLLKTCLEKDDAVDCLKFVTGNGSIFAPETTLGVLVNSQKQSEQPFLQAFDKCTQLDADRLCKPWFHPQAIYEMTPAYKLHLKCRNYICKFVDQIIKTKKQALAEEKVSMAESEQNIKHDGLKTFLELLIDSSGGERGYSDVELREETLVLVLAGTDTSAVGTAFASILLLLEVFGDSKRPVVAEDLPRLKYLEAVIRETLRLYPPVPIIARKIDKELTLRYQYAMMSMKTALSSLLRQYVVLPPSDVEDLKPFRVKFDIMMRDVDNFTLQLVKRV